MCKSDCSDFDNSPLKEGNIQSESDCNFKKTFYEMDSLRQRGIFCDVTLVTKNGEIPAHKVVLASYSDFLSNAFVKMGEEKLLLLEQIDGKILSALVNYVYTACVEVEISVIAVQNFLTAANILQLKYIREDCFKYLESNLNLNTSLNILSIARDHKHVDLLKKTEDFVDKNISEIINTQEFLNLPVDQLTQIITRDTLDVPSEEKIYEGVISWVKCDLTTRTKHLSVLMNHVRLSLISTDYLGKYIRNESLFETDIQCKNLIIDALLSKHIPQMIKPKVRKGSHPCEILLVMGNDCGEAKKTFEMYDFKTNHWSQVYSIPEKSEYNLAFVNRKLYVVSEDDISEYDMVNNCWCNSIKMSLSRSWCGVGVLNESIYAVGGYYNGKRRRSVEKFDIISQKWSSIPPMCTARYDAGVGVLEDLLYVVGGSSNRAAIVNSVECYDPKLNVWKQSSNLITGRRSAAVICLHNKMYVIGGHDGTKAINSVECYSSGTNRFTPSASLNIPRWGSVVVVFDDKLYAIGGYDGSHRLDNIEVYCPKDDEWELLPATMNVGRYRHGAVIIDKIIDF